MGPVASNQEDQIVNSPQISVVIPVGSIDELLIEQFDALARQDFSGPWEAIAALNTADPDAQAALEKCCDRYEFLRWVDAHEVRSASYARNVGAGSSSADLLAFCDGDDLCAPGWLTAMVAGLAEHSVVGGFLDEELLCPPKQRNWRPPATPGVLPTFLGSSYIDSANLGIRREVFEEAGGFTMNLTRGEDMAFGFELERLGYELAYLPEAVVYYRHRAGLADMLRQHYLYGIGMSEIVSRGMIPNDHQRSSGLGALKPNAQPVPNKSTVQVLRRGAIAVGRVVGLIAARRR